MTDILFPAKLVGRSAFCRQTCAKVLQIASSNLPVLICGDTGTGKEVIARMIHAASRRSDKVFLAVNCATLGHLADSELFGHVSGAFTGAVRGTHGYIGAANEGTLLLDEIGELAPEIQAKLLRFLDSGEYFRVGESEIKHADVRIIAATNQDLEDLCTENRFRKDLYYRISATIIKTVPLSERIEDIPLLVDHFIRLYTSHYKKERIKITTEAVEMLMQAEWPGNVRQLKYAVFRLCDACKSGEITAEQVLQDEGIFKKEKMHTEVFHLGRYKDAKRKALFDFDYHYFTTLLSVTQGRIKDILSLSGMHKKNFYAKMRELGLSPKDFRKK